MTYPGGKNGSGVYQTIINQMPPHVIYIEGFLGSGAIMRLKRPAPAANIGIDKDGTMLLASYPNIPKLEMIQDDTMRWLVFADEVRRPDTLLYLDPPYLMQTRSSPRPIYRYEMSENDHLILLGIIEHLQCMVMISGYYSDLYAEKLNGWRSIQFNSQCRSGRTATEWVWMNYPEPFELHDYRYLGKNFRERERIKRKKARWINRLERMSSLERYAMLDSIQQYQNQSTSSMIAKNSDTDIPADTGLLFRDPIAIHDHSITNNDVFEAERISQHHK